MVQFVSQINNSQPECIFKCGAALSTEWPYMPKTEIGYRFDSDYQSFD